MELVFVIFSFDKKINIMKNLVLSTALLGSILCLGQENTIINPKNKYYFGAEIGRNTITSFQLGESNKSLQGGLSAEYYFDKQWSVLSKIKYYETGVSFFSPDTHSGSWFDLGSDAYSGQFKGKIISIPLFLKWEFRMYKNLKGNLKIGYSYFYEISSQYENYSSNLSTHYSKHNGSLVQGLGLTYFINEKTAIYLDSEYDFGTSKGYSEGLFGKTHHTTKNQLTEIGIKYTFK